MRRLRSHSPSSQGALFLPSPVSNILCFRSRPGAIKPVWNPHASHNLSSPSPWPHHHVIAFFCLMLLLCVYTHCSPPFWTVCFGAGSLPVSSLAPRDTRLTSCTQSVLSDCLEGGGAQAPVFSWGPLSLSLLTAMSSYCKRRSSHDPSSSSSLKEFLSAFCCCCYTVRLLFQLSLLSVCR